MGNDLIELTIKSQHAFATGIDNICSAVYISSETPDKKPCKPMFNCLVNERSSVFSFFLPSIRKSQNAIINLLSKRK